MLNAKKIIDSFILETAIGKGSMGEVWKAYHKENQTAVAIKILRNEASQDPWAHEAFQSEIRNAARLTHPNAIMVLDHGSINSETCSPSSLEYFGEGNPYLVMEFIRGKTWHALCGLLSWHEAAPLIKQLLEVLAHAHARRVIHRDIKPDNILIEFGPNQSMTTVLTDFGLAQALSELENGSDIISGTPSYMAPEQLQGNWRDQGPWTDLYSLGCSIWRLFCKEAPYGNGLNFVDASQRHLYDPLPDFQNLIEVPTDLEGWLYRMIAKSPRERFWSAAEALFQFENFSSELLAPYNESAHTPQNTDISSQGNSTSHSALQITYNFDNSSIPLPKTWKHRPPARRPG